MFFLNKPLTIINEYQIKRKWYSVNGFVGIKIISDLTKLSSEIKVLDQIFLKDQKGVYHRIRKKRVKIEKNSKLFYLTQKYLIEKLNFANELSIRGE